MQLTIPQITLIELFTFLGTGNITSRQSFVFSYILKINNVKHHSYISRYFNVCRIIYTILVLL